jgi:hypothetical protein
MTLKSGPFSAGVRVPLSIATRPGVDRFLASGVLP